MQLRLYEVGAVILKKNKLSGVQNFFQLRSRCQASFDNFQSSKTGRTQTDIHPEIFSNIVMAFKISAPFPNTPLNKSPFFSSPSKIIFLFFEGCSLEFSVTFPKNKMPTVLQVGAYRFF